MRRLLFLTTALWLMLILAVFIARLIGQPQKLLPKLELLHLTDCALPCWIGIVPGKTTIGEARKRVKAFYGDALGYDVVFERSDSTFGEIIHAADRFRLVAGFNFDKHNEADEVIVETIVLSESEDDATLHAPTYTPILTGGDLYYNLLGKPEFLTLQRGEITDYARMLYYNRRVVIDVDCCFGSSEITPDAAIRGITLYHEMPKLAEWYYQPQPWRGFNASYKLDILQPQ